MRPKMYLQKIIHVDVSERECVIYSTKPDIYYNLNKTSTLFKNS